MRLKPMVSATIQLRFIRFKLNLHAAEAGGISEFSHRLGSDRIDDPASRFCGI
jgi:hypothetical protein